MTDFNYAAPELMGMCSECLFFECDGCPRQIKGETTWTDVYAYGRLYYVVSPAIHLGRLMMTVQVFFDAMPFEGQKQNQIASFISSRKQLPRQDSPRMDDDTWDLVKDCWFHNPSERPTMERIVANLKPRPESLINSLIAEVWTSKILVNFLLLTITS